MTRVLFAVAAVAALAATAHAQVDCSNPDNLCTGDPCVIPPIEVQVPCVVDFGTRTVEIPGMLRVPAAPEPNNDVSFSAGRIEIRGGIRIGRPRPPDVPGEVTLTATDAIVSPGRFTATPGPHFHLIAGGDIDLQARVRRDTLGTLEAGGSLLLIGHRTLQTCVPLRGAAGVHVQRRVVCTAGALEISSSAGDVVLDDTVDLRRPVNAPGSLAISAAGNVIGNQLFPLLGGAVSITNGGTLVFLGPVRASQLQVDGAGHVWMIRELVAAPGDIVIQGASVEVSGANARIDTSGSGAGAGDIRLMATGTDLTLSGAFSARGLSGTPGGVIEGVAAGNVVAEGDFDATGSPPGCIAFQAGGTVDTSGGSFDPAPVADCPG